ncbi:MAG: response regulator transcription factor [Candidatus Gracilibacteria bacterium]|nr:response regulator transcription factor [Candidatus Gracilibacteria bacterium]
MDILIIDDDVLLTYNLKRLFEKKILLNSVTVYGSYREFLSNLHLIDSFDIVLVDILLERDIDKNGIDIIKIIRKKNEKVPIVVMSSFSDIKWLNFAFDEGASDYIIKPFRLKEIEVRIMRWFNIYLHSLSFSSSDNLSYYDLHYCISRNEFYFNDEKLSLTRKSKQLLLIFISSPEKLLKEDFLVKKLWNDVDEFKYRNIRILVLRLKKSLKPFGLDYWIENIRGEGYIFKKDLF